VSRAVVLELVAAMLVVLAAVAAWELAPVATASSLVASLLGPWVLRGARTRARWGALALVPLLGGAGAVALGAPLAPSTAAAALALIALQRLGRASPDQDRPLIPLTALALALAAVVAPSLSVAAAIVLWAGAAPVLGLLSELGPAPRARAVGRHLVPIGGLTAALTIAIFLLIPRLVPAAGALAIDPERARIGFSDEVTLGELGELLDDARPALRLAIADGVPTHLIRGLTLDRFDGRRWTSTAAPRPSPVVRPSDALPVLVEQGPDAGSVAFAPGAIAAIEAPDATFVPMDDGSWRLRGPPRAVRYTAWLDPKPDPVPASGRERWLQLPALDPRVAPLAREVIRDAAPLDAAARVADHLSAGYTHTLAPRDRGSASPLSTFLFETRAGHCEYFATAAVILLRAAGHPARIVHGYARPDPIAAYWVVRHGHAHAWIEVLDAEGAWVAVDVTPGGPRQPPAPPPSEAWLEGPRQAFADSVVRYDAGDQIAATAAMARAIERGLPAPIATPAMSAVILGVVAALGAVGLVVGARHLARRLAGEGPQRPPGVVGRLHARARRDVRRAGYTIPASLPPVEAAAWLRSWNPDAGAPMESLAWLHYRVRYGGEADAALSAEARALATAVRRALRRRHNGLRAPASARAPR
jgi:protein-glutamine gamma-glutamyltransferase